MLITKKVDIKLNNKTKDYYYSIGYVEINGIFNNVDVSDLPKSSRVIISSKCDYCDNEKKIKYYSYIKNISFNGKFSCGNKCGSEKRKEISLEKYGVDSPSKLEHIKEKGRLTNIEKYGVDCYMKTDEFREKSKEKILERYGVEHCMYSQDIKDKLSKTIFEKYGVENVFQSEEIKEKIKLTNIEKYGEEFYSRTDQFKEKMQEISLEKYGVSHFSKSQEVKDKVRKTFEDKYGGFPFDSDILSKKISETIRTKYGHESLSRSEEYRIKNYSICDENYLMYLGNDISSFRCDEGHIYNISSSNYISRKKNNINTCTVCYPIKEQTSVKEIEMLKHIESIYDGEILSGYRYNNTEIDIYLPELSLGFEFNGLYFHSEKFKDKNYHSKKSDFFKSQNIRIIHIWEDDWVYKKDIIKSQINNLIGKSNKLFARNCVVKEIHDNKVVRKFLDENHIQGHVGSKIKIALFYKNDIVSIMTFDKFEGRKKISDESKWNLSRFCNRLDYVVVGGASKLLRYFIRLNNPTIILSYANRDWSVGDLYKKLGFNEISTSPPDYKYIVNNKRVHKSNFQKNKLKNKIKDTNIDFSESEIMRLNNFYKIYDCGKIKYEKLL